MKVDKKFTSFELQRVFVKEQIGLQMIHDNYTGTQTLVSSQ